MATHEYSVEVQPDFLERQAKALPVSAVAELIWNGLDADATNIEVEFGDDSLGGMSRIAISDNGHGIPLFGRSNLVSKLRWIMEETRCPHKTTLQGPARPGRARPFQGFCARRGG